MANIDLNQSYDTIIKEGSYNLEEIKKYEDGGIRIKIIENGQDVGILDGSLDCYSFHIELLKIYDKYQNKGYGHNAIESLKNICRDLHMKYIHGESWKKYKSFYTKLGAVYENRDEIDSTFILDKFYIDL